METIRTRSFARAGLLGNPSDGYFGKTLSFTFTQFGVELAMSESSRIRFQQGEVDDATFASMEEMSRNLRLYGYYGGMRLLKATAKRFFDYCQEKGLALPKNGLILRSVKELFRCLETGRTVLATGLDTRAA